MNQSIGLKNLIARCNYFRNSRNDTMYRKEYLVYMFFQFAKMNANEKPNLATEIIQIKRLIETKCKNVAVSESGVLDYLKNNKNESLTAVKLEHLLELAEKLATDSKSHEVATYHLFHVLFEDNMFPLSLRHLFMIKEKTQIKEIIDDKDIQELNNVIKNVKNEKEKEVKQQKQEKAHELLDLNERIKDMSEYILSKVKGQDHVVSTLASGYWNAEVLNEAD